jgi:hypothetical protein
LRLDYVRDVVDRVEFVELGEDAITIGRVNAPLQSIAYVDIAVVRLRYAPIQDLPEVFTCTLETRGGGRPVKFGNLSWVSWMTGYKPVAYRAFIAVLHERILRAGGRPQFVAGDTTGGFALRIAGAVIVGCVMIGILATKGSDLPGWAFAVMVAAFGWLIWSQVRDLRRNETRRYSAHAIPDNVLPTPEQEAS